MGASGGRERYSSPPILALIACLSITLVALVVACRYSILDCPCILPPSSRLPGVYSCGSLHVIVMELHILRIRPLLKMDACCTTPPIFSDLIQALSATKGLQHDGVPRIRRVLSWLPPPALPLSWASGLWRPPYRVRVRRPRVWRCVYRRE